MIDMTRITVDGTYGHPILKVEDETGGYHYYYPLCTEWQKPQLIRGTPFVINNTESAPNYAVSVFIPYEERPDAINVPYLLGVKKYG